MNVRQKIQTNLKNVIIHTASILFPMQRNEIQKLTKRHSWYNKKYVGTYRDKTCSWIGHSINLAYLDSRYRCLFADHVQKKPSFVESIQLFGESFALKIKDLDEFVVIFNLDIPKGAIKLVEELGFVAREISKGSHICSIYSIEEFLDRDIEFFALKAAEMVILQRNIAIHCKPLDSMELPFQHFLYQSNYLHGLVVKEGLWLKDISEPRKSGQFGHDLEISAISPETRDLLNIGVEVFMGAWGYHQQSIPTYIQKFDLQGLIVISKDINREILNEIEHFIDYPIKSIKKLSYIRSQDSCFPIYHLSLGDVVNDLFDLQDRLNILLGQTRAADLETRFNKENLK